MRTTVQVVWVLVAFAAFVLALIGLKSLGATIQVATYILVGAFALTWMTYRAYLKKP